MIETMLALFFVLLLALGALRLVVSAAQIRERSRDLAVASQIAVQELNNITINDERYSIQRQSAQQNIAQNITIQKTIVSIYDSELDKVIMSFVVYE